MTDEKKDKPEEKKEQQEKPLTEEELLKLRLEELRKRDPFVYR